jgi:hypothetical protein
VQNHGNRAGDYANAYQYTERDSRSQHLAGIILQSDSAVNQAPFVQHDSI